MIKQVFIELGVGAIFGILFASSFIIACYI